MLQQRLPSNLTGKSVDLALVHPALSLVAQDKLRDTLSR